MGRTLVIPSGGGAGGGITNINVSAGTTSNNLSNITFADAGGVSFGLDGSTITASAPAGGGGLTNIRVSAGTTSNLLSAITFADGNNISFGLNASTLTGSVATSLTNMRISAGTTSNLLSALTFANSNGLAFGLNASTLTGSYTVPTVTNSSWTVSDALTSGIVARLAFTNLNGVTLSLSSGAGGSHTIVGSHNALTSQSNQNVTAGNGGFAFQTLSFSNVNNFSFGTSAGSAITGSFSTSQSNQQMTMFATGNTTLSSTGTSNASSLIFRGSGAASIGITNGSILVDVAAGAAAITQSIGIESDTAGGATAGTSGFATGDDVLYKFVPGSNITMSQSLNGASATLTIYGASGGGGGAPTLSMWDNFHQGGNTSYIEGVNAGLFIHPLGVGWPFPGNMTVETMFFDMSGTVSTAAPFTRSISLGFYTMVNSTQLSRVFSASTSFGTNAGNMNVNDSFGGIRWLTYQSSQFDAGPTFSQTNYWMAIWHRSSSGSQTFASLAQSGWLHSGPRSGFISTGSTTADSWLHFPFRGQVSNTFTTAMPNSIHASDMVGSAATNRSQVRVHFNNIMSVIV